MTLFCFCFSIRSEVLTFFWDVQATVITLLLRNYLEHNLVEQADMLVAKTTFPPSASNNEWARYHYYLGIFSNYVDFNRFASPLSLSHTVTSLFFIIPLFHTCTRTQAASVPFSLHTLKPNSIWPWPSARHLKPQKQL